MKICLIASALFFGSLLHAVANVPPVHIGIRPPAAVSDSVTVKLTVVFGNVTKRTGKLYIALYNSAASFPASSYRKTRIEIPATGEASVSFDDLPAGQYAVAIYQDINDNQKLDREGGMPTEPYGFSNVTMLMGPPSFSQSAVMLTGDKTITVSLIGK